MTPTPFTTDLAMIPMLSWILPATAVFILMVAMPPVRKAFRGRFTSAHDYFYGPESETSEEDTGPEGDLPVETPSWLSMDLYNEDTPEQEATSEKDDITDEAPASDAERPRDTFEELYG